MVSVASTVPVADSISIGTLVVVDVTSGAAVVPLRATQLLGEILVVVNLFPPDVIANAARVIADGQMLHTVIVASAPCTDATLAATSNSSKLTDRIVQN